MISSKLKYLYNLAGIHLTANGDRVHPQTLRCQMQSCTAEPYV